ncbi:succinate--CoA ligase subunit alpha [Candidatus Saccharibacteria bacterium oral taxon 955]|nr:succinate--CoA ligase subunit alpha [Candidatus Saccharibacteria bacterium oral taxon 955]
MDKHIFTGKNVIIQGITGTQGSFHARNMIKHGTNIVAGTSPTKAGTTIENIPVYNSISAIKKDMAVDISIIFVPARYAKKAIIEAINARISLIICITEHVPVHDMLQISQHIQGSDSILIGPNCPGVLIPGVHSLGIIPAQLATSGDTAVVSRSGTLTYEAVDLLTKAGFGQKYIIGIGGDMIRGTSFVDCLEMFESDPDIKRIVMIGEIGGTEEIKASEYIKNYVTKPVYAYITGHSAPAGVQMGHAGAILNNNLESADTKTAHLKKSGAITANNIVELISLIR